MIPEPLPWQFGLMTTELAGITCSFEAGFAPQPPGFSHTPRYTYGLSVCTRGKLKTVYPVAELEPHVARPRPWPSTSQLRHVYRPPKFAIVEFPSASPKSRRASARSCDPPWPEWCSHCLRSRPATPIAVFATAPAPEAANTSAAAASARRSSAEGTVSEAAVNAACAERSKASDGPLGLLLPFVRFLLCQKRTQQVCGARPFLPTHLVAPQSHSSVLVAVKGPSTSYTFRLFSL